MSIGNSLTEDVVMAKKELDKFMETKFMEVYQWLLVKMVRDITHTHTALIPATVEDRAWVMAVLMFLIL